MEKLTGELKVHIKEYLSHEKNLSRAELVVVMMVIEGTINKDIAEKLQRREKTIKFHLTNIFKKLDVKTRGQIIWKLPLRLEKAFDPMKPTPLPEQKAKPELVLPVHLPA